MIPDKGIITIAIGGKYVKQAKFLAQSCILNSPHLPRAVITDCKDYLEPFYDIIIDYKKELGSPFETKTQLHLYSPFNKTLYIDADSLVYSNLETLFNTIDSSPFLYCGVPSKNGIWYYDIEKVIRECQVEWIPQFNSGMFLFSKNENSLEVFKTANALMQNHADLDIGFFRNNQYPDEPFFALALAKHGIEPFEDFGRFSRTLIGADSIRLNILMGYARFKKNGIWVFPSIVHFCGRLGNCFYTMEKFRLIIFLSFTFYRLFGAILVFLRKIFGKK